MKDRGAEAGSSSFIRLYCRLVSNLLNLQLQKED